MAKQKTRELIFHCGPCCYSLQYKNRNPIRSFCKDSFRRLCPNLAKDMKEGDEKKLTLTQVAKGIKLERID